MSETRLSREEAVALLERGEAAAEAHDWALAAACYEEFLAVYPDTEFSPVLWFDAALYHKFLRNWDKAYEIGKQAAARAGDAEGEPAFWNLGIAATMVRDWATARRAWAQFGIALKPGEGEIDDGFGMACVRLDPEGDAEVVWVRRICPTRGRVLSVPFTDRRFGEIVVHDGAPNGERLVGEHSYPVFDELALWQASDTATWRAQVTAPEEADMEALSEAFTARDLAMEPVDSIKFHCQCCSEGSIDVERTAVSGARDVLLAAPDEGAARGVLDEWAAGGGGRAWHAIHAKAEGVPHP
ncbi:MAG: tetratricopeptide repeat protein [Catenulispora sp.]|nr:tetratricopeptide repeat protein [Catenulispora sp.]